MWELIFWLIHRVQTPENTFVDLLPKITITLLKIIFDTKHITRNLNQLENTYHKHAVNDLIHLS